MFVGSSSSSSNNNNSGGGGGGGGGGSSTNGSHRKDTNHKNNNNKANNHNTTDDDEHHRKRQARRKRRLPQRSFLALVFGLVAAILLLVGWIIFDKNHSKQQALQFLWDALLGWNVPVAQWHNRKQTTAATAAEPSPKLSSRSFVTIVMPSVVNPNGRSLRLQAIRDTWGPDARAVFVLHDESAEMGSTGELSAWSNGATLTFPQVLVVPPHISPDNGVPRLQWVIAQVQNVDFAFFVNDHTYVFPQHLQQDMNQFSPQEPLYRGHALQNEKETYAFCSGAAGYLLSRQSLKDLVQAWQVVADPTCLATNAKPWLQGNPGLVTARCLAQVLHTPVQDSRDEQGRHLFHAFGLVRTVTGKVDPWYINKHASLDKTLGPDPWKQSHRPQSHQACCSPNTITFHYVEWKETRVLYRLGLELRGSKRLRTDKELKEFLSKEWPSSGSSLGGYSHPLPRQENEKDWKALLDVIRLIHAV